MKRCPQCDFTFEDYRQFCDFDGTELSVVPEAIVAPTKVPAPSVDHRFLFRRFSRSRSSLAALALAGITVSALVIGYYDSTNQREVDMASIAPTTTASTVESDQVAKPRSISTQRRIDADEQASSMPGSLLRSPSETSRFLSSKSRPGQETSKLQANTSRSEKAVGRVHARNQKRRGRGFERADKKDSRVVAILKKTGSILTKPFRL